VVLPGARKHILAINNQQPLQKMSLFGCLEHQI